MGAGCYYTHNNFDGERKRAFWIELDLYFEDEETGEEVYDDNLWDDTVDNLKYTFEDLGYEFVDTYKFENGLYTLELESGYMNEIVVKLEPKGEERCYSDEQRIYNLAVANHDRCYDKLIRALKKEGYKLRMATSGYTSGAI